MKNLFLLFMLLFWSHVGSAEPDGPKNLPEMIKNTRELRALMQSDPHRPIYHFVAPEGHALPFDPNGAIYWKGKYHLGYIYQSPLKNPYKIGNYTMTDEHRWGHAVSTDLVHWTQYPDMLNVKEGDIEKGIFSGGAFLSKEGIPHVIYYGLGGGANLIAYSTDEDLKVWKKFDGNPVLKQLTPDGANTIDTSSASEKYTVFDPVAWYDKSTDFYYQISGGGKPALFKSKDMYKWQYLGDLIDKKNTMRYPNEDLSCPDVFSLGNGKSMLLFISHIWGSQYYVGTFANDKFTVEQHARMNWPGGSFFAPEQLEDDKGRNIIWGWVIEHKPEHLPDYGWSGIMSLPRVVSMGADNKVRIEPAKELETIRLGEITEPAVELQANSERTLRASGKSIELKLEISGAEKSPAGVKVFASPDGREETVIAYDPGKKELVVNFAKSSIKGPVTRPSSIIAKVTGDGAPKAGYEVVGFPDKVSEQRAPLELKRNEPLKLNIFLDRSVIEIFANGQAVTQVVYPELPGSTQVKVFSGGEKITVKNIQSWKMAETNAY